MGGGLREDVSEEDYDSELGEELGDVVDNGRTRSELSNQNQRPDLARRLSREYVLIFPVEDILNLS